MLLFSYSRIITSVFLMKYERNEDTEAKVWQIISTDDDFVQIQIAQPKICVLDCLMKKEVGRSPCVCRHQTRAGYV